MVALTVERNTPKRLGLNFNFPVAAGVLIYTGAMVAIDTSGYVRPARATSTDTVIGRSLETIDNLAGDAGDLRCECEVGVFRWDNAGGGDAIALDDVGALAYALFDNQVGLTSSGGARPVAGVIVDVDTLGVWIKHEPVFPGGIDGDLVAANNLSDVASAATARGNLGIMQILHFRLEDCVSANALEHRYVHRGPDATIASIVTVTDRALTGGDLTITTDIDGVAVTTGVVTITQVGSAEADIDTVLPSAANVMQEGDVLRFLLGGAQTSTALRVDVTVRLTY